MTEPIQFVRGKQFQELVQKDFENNSKDGKVLREAHLDLAGLRHVKQKSGRMDILITELGDFVTVLEIKATDWDRIKPENVKRNLYRHQRQLLMYVDKHVTVDDVQVCLGIIYPEPPRKAGLRAFVESWLENHYGVPAYWYSEIRTPGYAENAE